MADSVDRVFTHALSTVRRLPRTGSSRPPPQDRLQLYGLYKQSMEGDVDGIMSRPTYPSPPLSDNEKAARELKSEAEKYDAWQSCAGMSKTEAKRKYISYLIETMKVYAVGTRESRELVAELEFVWEQVRNNTSAEGSGSGNGSGDSPPRVGMGGRGDGRLRVLSPVSQGGSGRRGEIIEGEDRELLRYRASDEEEVDEEYTSASEQQHQPQSHNNLDRRRTAGYRIPWRRTIEHALTNITAEIAALREQMEDSRVFPPPNSPTRLQKGRLARMLAWMRWLVWIAIRQLAIDALVLALIVLWGRWRGNRGAEDTIRSIWERCKGWIRRMARSWKAKGLRIMF
ncbi:MAG: hypothetical protein Q9160_007831 [Pyrenula sp. 1 TL-2023]